MEKALLQDNRPIERVESYNSEFLLKNALVLIDNGDFDTALKILDSVLIKNPDDMQALSWKGYCYKQKGQVDLASQEYIKLCYLKQSEEHFFEVAECFYLLGHDQLAKEYYTKALSIIDYESPYLFLIYKNLGNISVKERDFDSAEEFYNKAYTQNAHSDDLFVNYGTLEIQKDNMDTAAERFQEAIKLNENNDKAWIGLALIYRKKGDFDLSWANLKRALDIHLSNAVALKLCVEWALAEDECEYAIETLENYLSIHSESLDWLYTYAGLLYKSGYWKKTQSVCRQILEKNPDYKQASDLLLIASRKVDV